MQAGFKFVPKGCKYPVKLQKKVQQVPGGNKNRYLLKKKYPFDMKNRRGTFSKMYYWTKKVFELLI
ncbi:hypothetical protein GCM10027275_38340 [Rhabdobacter roseus]